MQQVLLLGELGERFGSKHEFENLRTPADAIRLFSINYPDFLPYLVESHENNIGYQIVQASTSLGEEDLFLPFGKKDLVITPVVMGSSDNPLVNFVAAVALISIVVVTGGGAAAFMAGTANIGGTAITLGATGFAAPGAALFSAAGMAAMAGNVGILLGLSSISQILNPMPEPPAKRLSSREAAATDGPQSVIRGAAGKQSYALTGPVNSVGLGTAVPIVYGEVITGSHILSVELEIESDDDEQSLFKVPSIDTIRFGSEKAEQGLKKIGGLYTANQTMFAPNNVWAGPTRWPYNPNHGDNFNRVGGGSYVGNGTGPGLNIPINLDPADNVRQSVKAFPISSKHSNWYMKVEKKDNSHYPAGRLQFLFSVSSLWRYISGVGSSVVDGFITYKVTVYNFTQDGTEVGGFQASIQGLTMNQPYWWVHQVSVAKIEDKDWHYFKLEIVDSDVDSSIYLNNFYVRGWGYYIANAHWPHCDSRGYQFDKGNFGGPQYTDGPRACPA